LNVDQRYRFVYKPLGFIAALIPFLWLLSGALGLFDISLGADPVKKIEHSLGKTALNLLLLTLLITPARHIAGLPHLPRLRRMLGLFAFFYATLHFVAYLSLDLEFNWHTLWSDIAKRPYITIGFSALILMIPLAITSTNRMMRRLGRRWQKLHRLVYPIAILGVWHFYWQVKRDVREPLIYAGILTVLLVYRWLRAPHKASKVTSTSVSATAPERT
jgi:sulfoxide reductase heme-binding subunit YedZ